MIIFKLYLVNAKVYIDYIYNLILFSLFKNIMSVIWFPATEPCLSQSLVKCAKTINFT